MAFIKWDQTGEKKYKTGVDHGVLYPQKNGAYPIGVAWNGLTAVNKTPSGAEDNKLYADNQQYLNLKSAEILGLTIECYMYPDEWAECNGESELAEGLFLGQQRRNTFGFSYRNKIGNDTEGEDYGYEINLVYGCSASPSEQGNSTINDSPEAATFSYEVSTTPVNVSGVGPDGKPYKPTACLTADSTKMSRENMMKLEEILYGKEGVYETTSDSDMTDGKKYYELINGSYVETKDTTMTTGKDYYEATTEPVPGRLPLPDELKKLFAAG